MAKKNLLDVLPDDGMFGIPLVILALPLGIYIRAEFFEGDLPGDGLLGLVIGLVYIFVVLSFSVAVFLSPLELLAGKVDDERAKSISATLERNSTLVGCLFVIACLILGFLLYDHTSQLSVFKIVVGERSVLMSCDLDPSCDKYSSDFIVFYAMVWFFSGAYYLYFFTLIGLIVVRLLRLLSVHTDKRFWVRQFAAGVASVLVAVVVGIVLRQLELGDAASVDVAAVSVGATTWGVSLIRIG